MAIASSGLLSPQDGPLACWSGSPTTVCAIPAGNFVQVSAGGQGVGLRCDGTIECWGGPCAVPSGTFSQVSAGGKHSIGLRTDGTIACWGDNEYGQCDPPSGTFSFVEAGFEHNVAIRTDGTVACWGRNTWGQCNPPAGEFIDVAAGHYNTVGTRANGTLACWGDSLDDKCDVPLGSFKQVTMGEWGGVALRTDGTLACWGWDPLWAQCQNTPSGTFTQVSASFNHMVALRPDGTVACWGSPFFEHCQGQPGGLFSQVAAGGNFSLGIKEPTIQETQEVDQCTVQLAHIGDVGAWPAQQGIAYDGEHFYTSAGTCTGGSLSEPFSPTRIVKWDPEGDDGWSFVTQRENVGQGLPKPTCHVGGIDLADGSVYAVLSDYASGSPLTVGYLAVYKALDLSPEWALDLTGLIANYDFQDFAGVAVGPDGFLYVVTYQSDSSKNTLVFKLDPDGDPAGSPPEAVYELDTRKANGIDIVDGATYVSTDLCPGAYYCGLDAFTPVRAAVEVYEELCIFGPSRPDERRFFEMPHGAGGFKHGEGLTVLSDDAIWTAEWGHVTRLGTSGQPDPFCGGPAGLEGDVNAVSLGAGGEQELELKGGQGLIGKLYLLLGSASGTSPGTPFGVDFIPLNFDLYAEFTLSHPNTPPLEQSFGFLDATGSATASISFPAGFEPALAGTELHHAAVVFDLSSGPAISFVSTPVPLTLLP